MKTILIVLFFSWLCFFDQGFAAETNKAQKETPCQDMKSVNFNDATVALNESEVILFNSGQACPIDSDAGRCCIEYNVVTDRLLQPVKKHNIRMVIINRNMLCGSGYGDYLLFYSCVNGRLKNILKKYYDGGIKYEEYENSRLIVTSAIWQSDDAHCCPSLAKVELYQWDSKSNSFLIKETETRPRKGH